MSGIRDCACGLRYWQHFVKAPMAHAGSFKCPCGRTLAAWGGTFRLIFEAETPETLRLQ